MLEAGKALGYFSFDFLKGICIDVFEKEFYFQQRNECLKWKKKHVGWIGKLNN